MDGYKPFKLTYEDPVISTVDIEKLGLSGSLPAGIPNVNFGLYGDVLSTAREGEEP